jgi:hypothetical protein
MVKVFYANNPFRTTKHGEPVPEGNRLSEKVARPGEKV